MCLLENVGDVRLEKGWICRSLDSLIEDPFTDEILAFLLTRLFQEISLISQTVCC